METKNAPEFVNDKLDSLNFESKFHVPPCSCASGGLSLYWNSCIDIKIVEACDNFIDTEIIYKKKRFFSTFTYGAPEAQNRREILQKLTLIGRNRNEPWFLTGDFNDILDNIEKDGGIMRPEGTFIDFQTFMSESDLFHLRHTGNFLSWRGVYHKAHGTLQIRQSRLQQLVGRNVPLRPMLLP